MERRLHDLPASQRDELTRQLVEALEGEADVVFAYLHGSFAGGAPFHDVDVAVYLADPSSPAGRSVDLAARLSRRFGYAFDVRALNDAPLSFQFRSLQGRLLLSRNDERLANLIEDTVRRYLDLAPILRRATREAFAG